MSRRKKNTVKVTYADGTVEHKRPKDFPRPIPQSRRARLAYYRRTPHWKKTRRQALERDGHRCTYCGARQKLEVHHKTYIRLGEELLEDVTTLCQPCHAAQHKRWMAHKPIDWDRV